MSLNDYSIEKLKETIDKINDRLDTIENRLDFIQKRGKYREYGESPYKPIGLKRK